MSVQIEDLELLDAVRGFALDHPHPDVGKFVESMRARGDSWQAVTPTYLAAAELLNVSRLSIDPRARTLMHVFERHKKRLRWEQSYKKEEGLVPEAMLAGYGFAEIIGRHGPFISERIRAGIGIWGPNILYPVHKHKAEEVYVVLAGSADFTVGAAAKRSYSAGDVVYVESNTPHGFCTTGQSLVVYYLWQAGDLRQQSQFGE